jgi:cytidine deaminase
VDGTGGLLVPCGRCRQLLYEFGGPDLLLDTPQGVLPLSEMLPQAFGPGHLSS